MRSLHSLHVKKTRTWVNWMTIIWYTLTTTESRFKVPTFYLAPQILVISDSKEPEYLEGEGAEQILAAYTDNMEARGYEAAADQEKRRSWYPK